MKQRTLFLSAFLVMLVVLASAELAHAQRLYDPERDAEAQKAAALAAEIASKGSFEKQLKNLDVTEKHNVEVYFTGARRQMEVKIRTFRTWGAVAKFANQIQETLDSEDFIPDADATAIAADVQKKDCSVRTTELGKAICAAKSNLAELQKAVAASEERGKKLDEELKSRLEKIDTIESLVDNAETLLKDKTAVRDTIAGLSEVFLKLAASTVTFINKLATINNETSDELRLLLQRIAVEALQLEVDHWKTVGEIKLRRATEQKEIQILVNDLKDRLTQIPNCFSIDPAKYDERITDSVARARTLTRCPIVERGKVVNTPTEGIIANLFKALHVATALAARGESPAALAELRLAHEERRFSIRHSAIVARSYEVALSSGTKRLARFYAGGLKPEKIAQLVYAAATVAIPGVIAGQ